MRARRVRAQRYRRLNGVLPDEVVPVRDGILPEGMLRPYEYATP